MIFEQVRKHKTYKTELNEEILRALSEYIDLRFEPEEMEQELMLSDIGPAPDLEESCDQVLEPTQAPASNSFMYYEGAKAAKVPRRLADVMGQVHETFQERLFRLIDERGLSDVEVYKKANLTRKLFSKIRSSRDYMPSKKTVIALALALELNLDEAVDLLKRAGMALSPGSKADLIVQFCIENGIYDYYTVNELLYEYDQPLLGA